MYTLIRTLAVALALSLLAGPVSAGPYSVSWGSGASTASLGINPLKKASGGGFYNEVQYYSYDSPYGASANTPDGLEESNTLTFFLFENGDNDVSMFMIIDAPNDGSGSTAYLDVTSTGLAGIPLSTLVRDDPGDSSYAWNVTSGTMSPYFQSWPCCTDGMVLGYLPNASDSSWTLNYSFRQYSGLSRVKIWYLDDPYEDNPLQSFRNFQIPMSQLNTLVFSRTGESVAMPAATTALFPLAAFGLLAIRRRNR